LISLAAALLVTRSTQNGRTCRATFSTAILAAAGVGRGRRIPGILVFTNLPAIPLLTLGRLAVHLAVMLSSRRNASRSRSHGTAEAEAGSRKQKPEERIEDYLGDRPDGNRDRRRADSSGRPWSRRRLAATHYRRPPVGGGDIGIVLPKVRIRDNMRLGESQLSHQDRQQPRLRKASLHPETSCWPWIRE
jgi:flagellar biosynthesis protein FlhA